MFERFPLHRFSAKDPAFLEVTRQTSRGTEKVLCEPRVTFLLGFPSKRCAEMCYFYGFLGGVKGITRFLTSSVDSGEPYQGQNCAFTAQVLRTMLAFVCLLLKTQTWFCPAFGIIHLDYESVFCSSINFCTWPVWRHVGSINMGYFISESYTLSIINSFKITPPHFKISFSSGVANTKRDRFPAPYEGFAVITEPREVWNPP